MGFSATDGPVRKRRQNEFKSQELGKTGVKKYLLDVTRPLHS